MPSANTVNSNRSNSYLELREAKIARNNARLQELGLLSSQVPLSNESIPKRKALSQDDTEIVSAVPKRRRSLRLCRSTNGSEPNDLTPPVTISSNDLSKIVTKSVEASSSSIVPTSSPTDASAIDSILVLPTSRRVSVSTSNSARDIELDIQKLLFGTPDDPTDNGFIGKQLTVTGKAFVIEESVRCASSVNLASRISFNKYSGVQEWGNDVLYLWINFGAPNCEVENQFFEKGRQVNWFGGSRMHDGTPVINKLKSVGVHTAKGNVDSCGSVVLWARQYCHNKKGFEPYVCFGRLSLVSYDPMARPIAFMWKLLDYERLVSNATPEAKVALRKMTIHI